MKKSLTKAVDKLVSKTLKMNINSTSSLAMFQPKVPKELQTLSQANKK